jgi:3-oxoacyl-[acyl-carrier protein] reductase
LKSIAEAHGPIDILVNNAAIVADNLMMRMKQDQWDSVIQVNLNAAFHLMKACIRPMVKKRWGRVINLSSVVGFTGNLGQANYCAAKAGLVGMSKAIALEVARYGVTINCVAPGFIETDMTAKLDAQTQEAFLTQIPMGRMGAVQDIVEAVSFLASDKAGYMTGSTLHVNGGLFMQ